MYLMCYTIIVKRKSNENSLKKIKKNLKKPLDKPTQIDYNKGIR